MLIFRRSDLNENCKDVLIEEIGVDCYPNSLDDVYKANIVLFVDGKQTKILKNKYGYEGIVNRVVKN